MTSLKIMNRTSKLVFVAVALAASTNSALRADSLLQDKQSPPDSAATAVSVPQDETIASASIGSAKSSLTVVNGKPSDNYPPGTLVVVMAGGGEVRGLDWRRYDPSQSFIANDHRDDSSHGGVHHRDLHGVRVRANS